MYAAWGILSAAIVIVIEFVLLGVPYSIHNQSLGIVFPIGGILDGGLCALGLVIFLKVKDRRLRLKHCLSGVVIAFLSFWAIYFVSYSAAYVDNGVINYNFKGDHISHYTDKNGEQFSFGNYLKYRIRNISFKSTYAGGFWSDINNFGDNFNTFIFMSECFGFCLGGFAVSGIALEDRGTCRKCKNPFWVKRLYVFKPEYFDGELKGLKQSLHTKEEFQDYIYKDREPLGNEETYIEVSLKYCNSCSKGNIVFNRMVPRVKGGKRLIWIEDKDAYKQLELSADELKNVE